LLALPKFWTPALARHHGDVLIKINIVDRETGQL
jgi:hypothetical protein